MICEICKKEYVDLRVLAWHISSKHKNIDARNYTVKYFYGGKVPKCQCGCSKEASYRYLGKFMRFITGHNTSVYNGFKGKHHTEEEIGKMMGSDGYRKRIMKGKFQPKASFETKRKMRVSALDNIIKLGAYFCGMNEKSLLNEQEKINRCKIERNYRIKNLGYIVDGYDIQNNTVYEVYEKHHDHQVQKDLNRENEICNHLSCDFIIIHDRTH